MIPIADPSFLAVPFSFVIKQEIQIMKTNIVVAIVDKYCRRYC